MRCVTIDHEDLHRPDAEAGRRLLITQQE
jgi:hypothetical protein